VAGANADCSWRNDSGSEVNDLNLDLCTAAIRALANPHHEIHEAPRQLFGVGSAEGDPLSGLPIDTNTHACMPTIAN
jgi:hypothetical protein